MGKGRENISEPAGCDQVKQPSRRENNSGPAARGTRGMAMRLLGEVWGAGERAPRVVERSDVNTERVILTLGAFGGRYWWGSACKRKGAEAEG